METVAGGTLELDLRSEIVVVTSEDGRPSKKLITLSSSNVVSSNDNLLNEILLRLPVLSILLLYPVTCDKFYVYNPSTDLFRLLSSRHVLSLGNAGIAKIKIAFDPRRSTCYKVVSADFIRDDDDDNESGMSALIQTYSSETGVWSVCDSRFPMQSFFRFKNPTPTKGREAASGSTKDIADYPVLTNLQTLGFLDGKAHRDSKLCESSGCLLLVYREFPDSLFDVYEMRNESSGWLLKYTVNLGDTIMRFPKRWSVSSTVCCIALEDREEDSFMVINISGQVREYKFMSKTQRKLRSLGSVRSSESFMFIASFASV
ncbi:hypothetical protein Tco_1556771 [Tanacetum coccineum]